MRGQAAWDALQEALETCTPPCTNDERFIADQLTPGDEIELTELCGLCPMRVRAACETYAQQGRVNAGWWAGRRRN